jgi:nucleotide-binding universal stress UspA family protein
MTRILVAVDGSAGASRAARFAAHLAKGTGAELELLHVYDAPTAVALGVEALTKEELAARSETIGKGSFEKADEAIGDVIAATHHVELGHPAKQIVLRAQEIDADIIVLGSRGLSSLEGLLLGSISKRVLQLAGRPVTVVP